MYMEDLGMFLKRFIIKYDEEKAKLPYHMNLLDELHANENAHSRILGKLLMQRNPENGRCEMLESFVRFVVKRKDKYACIKICNPKISLEERRIDLWVKDKDYTIIIENKVRNAKDQPRQIERYIDAAKNAGFIEKQIYVAYLPPTGLKEPSNDSWGKYLSSDIYEKRYVKLSYDVEIFDWLKSDVLPNIRRRDVYLSSAVEQYVDYLEGMFSLRTIDKPMNMELQKLILDELKLNQLPIEEQYGKINAMQEKLENLMVQLSQIKESKKKEWFASWEERLKSDGYKVCGNWKDNWDNASSIWKKLWVELPIDGEVVVLTIEYDAKADETYVGICKVKENENISESSLLKSKVFNDIKENLCMQGESNEWWYCWKYTTFEDAYNLLKSLIEEVRGKNERLALN